MKPFRCWIIGRILLIVLPLLAMALFGCSKKQPETKEIKIGAILPMTGDAAKYGKWITNGMEIAIGELNAQGGIGGKRVILRVQDSKTNPAEGLSAFRQLVQTEKPAIVMTTLTGVCRAIIPVAEEKHVIVFANSTFPGITENRRFIFRNMTNLSSDIPMAVEYVSNKLGKPDVAVIWRNDDFGLWGSKKFNELYTVTGGKIVASESYDPDTQDFRTIITKVAANQPKLVYLLGYSEVGTIAWQAVELGHKWQYLGITTMGDPEALKLAGGALDGAMHTEPASALASSAPRVVAYREKYRQKYGEDPEVWSATFYDAVKIFALAAQRCNLVSVEALRDELLKVKDYMGVSGRTSFLPNGDVLKPVELHQIKGGQSVPLAQGSEGK